MSGLTEFAHTNKSGSQSSPIQIKRRKIMTYSERVLENVKKKNPNEPEFIQAVTEVLNSLTPVFNAEKKWEENKILERIVEPERVIIFRVPWVNDKNEIEVNRGIRVQFNSAIGPYKGGLRFHPSVNLSILKFLGFEQVFKNSLTTLPMGGGKGGSDFDPKGKSDNEVMRFCQSFMTELYRHIGENVDIPAGDIGVGAREVGFLYGQYKRIRNSFDSVLTGKGLSFGGSLARPEATGYGLLYITKELLENKNMDIKGMRVCISGSGNVAIFACEKAMKLGAKVVTMSDSNGFIVDEDGIDIELVKEIKLKNRGRIKEYAERKKNAVYKEGKGVWNVPCDIALPCATQNELNIEDAKSLVKNGVKAVLEGANMPTTLDATKYLKENKIYFIPGKASNAGGVAVSGLEMSQNAIRRSWTFETVDKELENIMKSIYKATVDAQDRFGIKDDFVAGSNIAGFLKVGEAMIAQGVV